MVNFLGCPEYHSNGFLPDYCGGLNLALNLGAVGVGACLYGCIAGRKSAQDQQDSRINEVCCKCLGITALVAGVAVAAPIVYTFWGFKLNF